MHHFRCGDLANRCAVIAKGTMVIEAELVKDATENSVESSGKKIRIKFRFKYGLARIFLSFLMGHSALLSLSDVVNYAFLSYFISPPAFQL